MLALPHTVTSKAYSACAFTQKVLKFCDMMHARGHVIYHYGHERSEVQCFEHISVMNDTVLDKTYGLQDWHSKSFEHNVTDAAHVYFNIKATEEVAKRKQRGDFLLMFWGSGHEHVGRTHSRDMIVVEPGIGSFNNIVAPFCIFESYAVMHYIYGKYNIMPRFMDSVIPNYFDPADFVGPTESIDDFVTRNQRDTLKGSLTLEDAKKCLGQKYILMICRIIPMKGIQVAVEACKKAGIKLIIAGQGKLSDALNATTVYTTSSSIEDDVEVVHVGYVEPRERAILLHGCKALIAPTMYNEPFGGVNVEAQMSGKPVITTDWGGFSETVIHGVTGYRCRTMEQFTWAINNVEHLDTSKIREWASNYSLSKIATMYEEYFSMISSIMDDKGFYAERPQRLSLKWLEKKYV